MYIAAGQGQTTPGDKIFMSTETSCHFGHLLQVKKISLWSLLLYIFCFMILYMYTAPGQGLTTPLGWNFDVNRNVLSFHSFVASLKKMSLKSDFKHFFHDLIHLYSPGAAADSPQGTKFLCQQKGLIILPTCCKFQRTLFEVWFYTMFFMIFFYKYIAPGQGAYSPQGTKFDVNRNFLSLGHLLLVSNHRRQ